MILRPIGFAAAILSLALFSAGCAELDLLLGPGDGTTGSGAPLSASSDPAVQAAGASSDAVEKLHAADDELEQGLESKDVQHVEKAIELRPYDESYRYYRAVLLYAEESEDAPTDIYQSLSEAIGLQIQRLRRTSGLSENDLSAEVKRSHVLSVVDALAVTKTYYARDSRQWRRLNQTYCNWLNELRSMKDGGVAASFYSSADCTP